MNPRTIRLLCYGKSTPTTYRGMGGAVSTFTEQVLLYESWRPFSPGQAPGFVRRFMSACEGVWPEWMPPQKPKYEMILT